jgi:lysophospholipase L1-like esterase
MQRNRLILTAVAAILLLGTPVVSGAGPTTVYPPKKAVDAEELGTPTPITDPSDEALAHFHESLAATARGEKTTRILVWGASHMAGDSFTRLIRHRLQGEFGDAGPGFAVPGKPWRNYNHKDLNISYDGEWESYWVGRCCARDDGIYGISGTSVVSGHKKAWAKIETAKRSDFGNSVTSFEVFYYTREGGGDLKVYIDGRLKDVIDTNHEVAGPAYKRYVVPDGPHNIVLKPKGNGEVTLFGVASERDEFGVLMDTLGINGAKGPSQLKWDDAIFTSHMKKRNPDLIIMAYGTNATGDDDTPIEKYEAEFDQVVARWKAAAPDASCVMVGPSDWPVKVETEVQSKGKKRARKKRRRRRRKPKTVTGFQVRQRAGLVIDVQRRVAHKYGCGYWDWRAAMGGELSMLSWRHSTPVQASGDYVHFTRRGYEKLAELFYAELMKGYVRPE